MTKTATVILSSPRKGSNSNSLASAITAGLEEAGGRAETFDLYRLDVKPCLACEACQRNGGKCVQADGMKEIYPRIQDSDILILASPVYWFNMSGPLKIFLDRCFAVAMVGDKPFSQKTIAAALAYGDVDPYVSGAVNAIRTFQDVCAYTGAAWGGCIYGSAMAPEAWSKDEALLGKAREFGRNLVRSVSR